MAQVWDYNGFTIDEGLKPRDGNFKPGYYQHFFLVKRADERIMKFCVWAPKNDIAAMEIPEVDGAVVTGTQYVRAQGLKAVKRRIDAENFSDSLLEITTAGARIIPLEKLDEKKT